MFLLYILHSAEICCVYDICIFCLLALTHIPCDLGRKYLTGFSVSKSLYILSTLKK